MKKQIKKLNYHPEKKTFPARLYEETHIIVKDRMDRTGIPIIHSLKTAVELLKHQEQEK